MTDKGGHRLFGLEINWHSQIPLYRIFDNSIRCAILRIIVSRQWTNSGRTQLNQFTGAGCIMNMSTLFVDFLASLKISLNLPALEDWNFQKT